MTEWRLTPEYILSNWTDEELNLMVEKMAERKQRERAMIEGQTQNTRGTETMSIPLETLAQIPGSKIKVIKHGD